LANQVLYINNRQNGRTWHKKALTPFAIGQFVEIDGTTGFVIPATNTKPVLGVTNESIDNTSSNYALNDSLSISEAVYNDELIITVSSGPATALMEGRYLAIDAAATGVVIAGISTTVSAATPILVTKFINATTILGKIAFRF
jgi:hypothetical protein